jgi:hypothetical protein
MRWEFAAVASAARGRRNEGANTGRDDGVEEPAECEIDSQSIDMTDIAGVDRTSC